MSPNSTKCYDDIVVFHQYMSNDIEIEDSTNFSNTTYLEGKSTGLGYTKNNNENILILNISHKSKNKVVKAFISYIDATHLKIDKIENL
ncbi:Uncharacterised protein [Chryseobacterium indoltheticum]|uniref:Uncharacterized protein n=2 Tax=Chryseobacterium indoltheticum TaxID=254 RepID=A0A381FI42_9FLAO|nr:Uncharacterised protein [Chryseobacterium indoltheticum]